MSGIHRIRCLLSLALGLGLGLAALSAQALSFLPWEHVRTSYIGFEYGGVTHTVGILAPEKARRNAPAVIVLHFNLGTAASMANLTEVGEFARDHGAWVILPQAADLTWSHAPNELGGGTDDAGYLAALIDYVVQAYDIDSRRVYMTGYSQGGNMTVRMACEYPGKIAAGAVVAATMRKSLARQCNPSVPTPMVFFNGTDDEQVPYGPGIPALLRDLLGVGALGAQDAAKYWAEINGCTGSAERSDQPSPIDDGTTIQLDRYTNCPANRGAAIYTIIGGGHTWPGVLDFVPVAGITTQNLRANKAMWEFFKEFSR